MTTTPSLDALNLQFDAFFKDAAKPLGNHVKCDRCGREQKVDPSQCLRRGWPTCCNETMRLQKT